MRSKRWRGACRAGQGRLLAALAALAALGCEIDERDVHLRSTEPLREDPSVPDAAGLLTANLSSLDLGAVVTGFPALGRVTLSNDGGAALGLSNIAFEDGQSTDFQILQDECGSELLAGASCDVRLQFLPAQLGPRQNALLVRPGPGGVLRLPVQGRGLQPGRVLLSPAAGASADFGGVLLGESATADFLVTNSGSTASGALSFELANDAFELRAAGSTGCIGGQTTLQPGASCAVRLTFAPTERGPNEASLSVSSISLGSSSLALSGAGLQPGSLRASSDRLRFPGVVLNGAGTATLIVLNLGDVAVTLAATALQGEQASSFNIASNGCREGSQLSAGAECNVDVEFRPRQVGASAANLVLAVNGAQLSILLEAQGLTPGVLTLQAEAPSFGDVLLGEQLVQRVLVGNPVAKPSGPLTLSSSGDFGVLAPSQPGDCVSGVTNLGGGESCAVTLQLAPTQRGIRHGTLTVLSELAGNASLPLQGRATLPGRVALGREEVDFGEVARAASASAQLMLSNTGDLPIGPLSFGWGSVTSGSASSFSFDQGCAAGLARGASCPLEVSFRPGANGAHSITLLPSGSGRSSSPLLLRGVGVDPGALTLQPAADGGGAFGDVPANTTVQHAFRLNNPGGVASGVLSISTSNPRFVVSDVSCAALGGTGLAAGASCDFRVGFTPVGSEALTANLTVTAPAAGRVALPLSGRGRRPGLLQGSSFLDFGSVLVSEVSGSQRWTLTNAGDLPTGLLGLTTVSSEFPISFDDCSGRSLGGGGAQCSLLMAFRPQIAGQRSGEIRISDGSSGGQASLTLSGFGQAPPVVEPFPPTTGGECPQAAVCPNPNTSCITSVPFETNWDTSGLPDLYIASCSGASADVQLMFVAPFSGSYRFESTGSPDAILSVLNGACSGDSTTELGCNDDFDANVNRDPRVEVPLTAGQIVTIYVGEFGGAVGAGLLRITLP